MKNIKPTYGDIVSLDNTKLVQVDEDTQRYYKYTGSTVVASTGVRCATFLGKDGIIYMQPWAITNCFKRRGESNIGSFLKNEQVIEMVKSFILDKVDVPTLAIKYQITEDHCQNIVSGQVWRHITIGLIQQLTSGGDLGVTVKNQPTRRCKLSAAIVVFLRKDATIHKMSVKALATKYCISASQVRKILVGKAWRV